MTTVLKSFQELSQVNLEDYIDNSPRSIREARYSAVQEPIHLEYQVIQSTETIQSFIKPVMVRGIQKWEAFFVFNKQTYYLGRDFANAKRASNALQPVEDMLKRRIQKLIKLTLEG